MTTQHLTTSDGYLNFSIEGDSQGQVEPVVKVKWRLTETTIELLAQKQALTPHILLVVEAVGIEQQRHVLPVEAGEWYLYLHSAGTNTIHACIVWADNPKDRSASRLLLKKHNHDNFVNTVLRTDQWAVVELREVIDNIEYRLETLSFSPESDEALRTELADLHTQLATAVAQDEFDTRISSSLFYDTPRGYGAHQLGQVKLDVSVPRTMFAESLPSTHWLAGLLFKSKPKDQCQLRKRAIIAAFTAPIVLPAKYVFIAIFMCLWWLAGGLVVAGLSIAGVRNLDYDYFNPDSADTLPDIWSRAEPSRWWYKEVTTGSGRYTFYVQRHWIFYFINPVVLLVLSAIVLFAWWLGVSGWWLSLPFVAVLSLILILLGVSVLDSRPSRPAPKKSAEKVRQEITLRLSDQTKRNLSGTSALQLKFLQTKAKFCKPFAR